MSADDVIAETKSRIEALIAPIDGGVGTDVSYDTPFELVKNEVDKLQALEGGKVDWGTVASTADEVLSEKSKDFRLALYYSAAKLHLDGLGGLLEGLVLVDSLVTSYWEPMFPALKRPKARGNLCGWYNDLAVARLGAYQPVSSDADVVKAIEQILRNLDGELRDKLGEHYPGMLGLQNLARSLVASLPVEAPPPPPPSPASSAQPAAPSSEARPAESYASAPAVQQSFSSSPSAAVPDASGITDAASAMDFVEKSGDALVRAGDALRNADATDPFAYRILRVGIWISIQRTPPAEAGRTLVPAPPKFMRTQLDGLIAAENWVQLMHQAEEAAAQYILWLDPHRYLANAMDRAGPNFLNAKKAVIRELGILLLRAPKIETLEYSDGTPLADGSTKMWIESEVAPALGGGGGGGGGSVASFLEAPLQEARSLAGGGKLPEAIDVITKAANAAPSGVDRFRGRLAVAKLCLQAEQFSVARAQLEGLASLVEHHRLTDWEPDLCADVYSALYAAHKAQNRGDEVAPEARLREAAAFERLCQLDAGAAIKLSTG
jgi:type VI secretion system protein VasJ